MYSSEELERLCFQYQTEGMPKGICPENPSDTRRLKMNVVEGIPCTLKFMADMAVNC